MEILRDRRLVKSFLASLAINALCVCIVGGIPLASVRTSFIHHDEAQAVLHPVLITVSTIPLTYFPGSSKDHQAGTGKSSMPGQTQSMNTQSDRSDAPPRTSASATQTNSNQHRQSPSDRRQAAKNAANTNSNQNDQSTPTSVEQKIKIALGRGGHYNDLPSGDQTVSGSSSKNASSDTGPAGKPNNAPPQNTGGTRATGSQEPNGLAREANIQGSGNSHEGAKPLHKNSKEAESKKGTGSSAQNLGVKPQTGKDFQGGVTSNRTGAEDSSLPMELSTAGDSHGFPNSNNSGYSTHPEGMGSATAAAGYTQFGVRNRQGGQYRSTQAFRGYQKTGTGEVGQVSGAKNDSQHTGTSRYGPGHGNPVQGAQNARNGGGTIQDAYVGQVYTGSSPVNTVGKQPAAADPGFDPGTAVHALHLPKYIGDNNHAHPGPQAAPGQTIKYPLTLQERQSFSVVPADLGSMSLFGTILWGTPAPTDQKDPNVGTNGMGLLGSYYVGSNFDKLEFQRADSNINYIWTGTGPGPLMPSKQPFTVRWTGKLISTYTEPYTIMTASDDGVRVYLNGNLIIDNWTVHAVTEDTATVDLVANQPNDITVEYFEKNGMSNEIIKLYWESQHQPLEYVPETSLLYPQTH